MTTIARMLTNAIIVVNVVVVHGILLNIKIKQSNEYKHTSVSLPKYWKEGCVQYLLTNLNTQVT